MPGFLNQYIIRISVFLLIIFIIVVFLYPVLQNAFLSNIYINAIIILSLLFGLIFNIYNLIKLNFDSSLLETNEKYNRSLSLKHVKRISNLIPKGATVAVLGLSYKPETHIIEESPGIYLCQELSNAGFRVIGHDFLADKEAEPILRYKSIVTNSLDEALNDAQVVIITKEDSEYLELSIDAITRNRDKTIVIDFWRKFEHFKKVDKVEYIPIGICVDNKEAEVDIKKLWD